MKKILYTIAFVLVGMAAQAQTLNVTVGNVTDQYSAAQTGEMTFTAGTQMTIMGKTYDISQIGKMWTDDTAVKDNEVNVVYSGDAALVYVAGNIAQYVTATVSGAHVSITQSDAITNDLINDGTYSEITYNLSGASTDGSLTLGGSAKCTVAVNGLELTNPNSAPINITNGKRVDFSIKKGTTNTLKDGTASTAKACLYCKGHLEISGSGSLNVTGNTRHGIASKEYLLLKKTTGKITIAKAAGDAIHAGQYFQMNGGTLNISGMAGDGIQAEITDDPTEEMNGQVLIKGGSITMTVAADDTKGIKSDSLTTISGGTFDITASGAGTKGISSGTDMIINEDDNTTKITIKATGSKYTDPVTKESSKCMGIRVVEDLTISAGTVTVSKTYSSSKGIKVGGTYYAKGGTVTADVDATATVK